MATKYIQEFESTAAFLAAAPDVDGVLGIGAVANVPYANVAGAAVALTTGKDRIITPTAAVTLTAEQSDATIMLNASAGFAITLPAPAAGLRYRFTTAAAFATTNFTVGTSGGANIIEGSIVVAGVVVDADARDTINFVATAENLGDFAEVWSDGTSWFVFGNALTSGAITFSQS